MITLKNLDKQYIGKVEAFEIAMERGFDGLPHKNRQYILVPAIATGSPILILGKDEHGYFTSEEAQ